MHPGRKHLSLYNGSEVNNPKRTFRQRFNRWVKRGWPSITLPLTVWFLFHNRNIHPAYNATWWRLYTLARRLRKNGKQIRSGSSYRAHLAMAAKLLETPPDVDGVVVECGCFKGGSTANLSIVCDFVGRDLIVYDSFEGLPEEDATDRYAASSSQGHFRGELEVVKGNIERYGVLARCTFRNARSTQRLPRPLQTRLCHTSGRPQTLRALASKMAILRARHRHCWWKEGQ